MPLFKGGELLFLDLQDLVETDDFLLEQFHLPLVRPSLEISRLLLQPTDLAQKTLVFIEQGLPIIATEVSAP